MLAANATIRRPRADADNPLRVRRDIDLTFVRECGDVDPAGVGGSKRSVCIDTSVAAAITAGVWACIGTGISGSGVVRAGEILWAVQRTVAT